MRKILTVDNVNELENYERLLFMYNVYARMIQTDNNYHILSSEERKKIQFYFINYGQLLNITTKELQQKYDIINKPIIFIDTNQQLLIYEDNT